ncbi:hypothetical protein [Bradyrhizobium sp. McL0616]|uniref:hypothetical protein n=1 Tax=Bradyrhizobium sp. McL0616 TaxID=3415674 RepID=UPI003CEA4EC2
MTCLAHQDSGPCPCSQPQFPTVVCNPPDLPAIDYRVGDYLLFRDKLLRPSPGEIQLTAWQPGAQGDLAVQMIEWWAYLADILSFYNERIANEAYLGTAILPESVNHLVQLLGYRPRPALGSKVTLAGLLASGARAPVALPKGMQLQSKPAPGAAPQVFELDAATQLQSPDIISAKVVPKNHFLLTNPGAPAAANSLWLDRKVGGIKVGDSLLLINANAVSASPSIADYAWISVTALQSTTSPLGDPVTALNFTPIASTLVANAKASDYVLLRSGQSSPLWGFPTTTASLTVRTLAISRRAPPITTTTVHLAGLARILTPGGLFLLDATAGSGLAPVPSLVQTYSEQFWYANCGASADASALPTSNTPPPIGIPISTLTTDAVPPAWEDNGPSITVRYAFARVGGLTPVLQHADVAYPGGGTTLAPAIADQSFPDAETTVLVEDGGGDASLAFITPTADGAALTLSPAQPTLALTSPIDLMFDLLAFSRGQTVPAEVLGSGNPVVTAQDFTLKNAPVTYFADPASISGDGFSSTVQVSVNNVLWREVQSFYGQSRNAQVFVLHEDDSGKTHATFGDGLNGAQLPTGTNNIVATYRYGAGAAAPAGETLTVIQSPQPGLMALRNPLQPTGGADADDPARLKTLAPRSMLTFGRAVSKDDYVAIALTAGADQASAAYAFDPISQRPKVTLWVAGDANAGAGAKQAVLAAAIPGQGLDVEIATPVEMTLSLTFLCDSTLDAPAIKTALTAALTDPDTGLFGARAIGIGQVVYDSQILAACLNVAGVQAVHDLSFANDAILVSIGRRPLRRLRFPIPRPANTCSGRSYNPGAGKFFTVSSLSLNPAVTGVA